MYLFLSIRSRNNLLNGDVTNYDWDSGYTCHQLGSGSILVQLGQPYMIDSMRYDSWILFIKQIYHILYYTLKYNVSIIIFTQITTLGLR